MSMKAPVAMLSAGASTDPWVFAELDKCSADWAHHSFDLKLALSDPLKQDRVSHLQNGTAAKTIVAV